MHKSTIVTILICVIGMVILHFTPIINGKNITGHCITLLYSSMINYLPVSSSVTIPTSPIVCTPVSLSVCTPVSSGVTIPVS